MEDRFCLQMVRCGNGCGTGNSGTGAENDYSTEETVCGKWIDGKPIYRKVISGTSAAVSGANNLYANVSALKIDKVINLYGNASSETTQIPLPCTYIYSNKTFASFFTIWYNTVNENIYYDILNQDGMYASCPMYVVLEYTKK